MIDLGVRCGFIDKSGAWYSYQGERLGQGKDKVRELLIQKPELFEAIEEQIRAQFLSVKSEATPATQASEIEA